MKLLVKWLLPIQLASEANSNEHWTKKSKRHRSQKQWINFYFNNVKTAAKGSCTNFAYNCHVKMTRVASRFYDDDNNISAFKYIRDAIAENLRPGKAVGQADSDKTITWEYSQEKGSTKLVRIEIFARE